jgi:hypothetical protein
MLAYSWLTRASAGLWGTNIGAAMLAMAELSLVHWQYMAGLIMESKTEACI